VANKINLARCTLTLRLEAALRQTVPISPRCVQAGNQISRHPSNILTSPSAPSETPYSALLVRDSSRRSPSASTPLAIDILGIRCLTVRAWTLRRCEN